MVKQFREKAHEELGSLGKCLQENILDTIKEARSINNDSIGFSVYLENCKEDIKQCSKYKSNLDKHEECLKKVNRINKK